MSGTIRTLFWDIGGVVLTNGWDKDQRARVLGRLGVDLELYEQLHEQANFYWERGLLTAEDFFKQTVLRPSPQLAITFPILWKLVCAESKVLHPECLDLLSDLKQAGEWKLATLNNESRELNQFRIGNFKLRRLFDFFVCSGYVHEMKPKPGIYQAAIEICGYPAERTLFIDDKPENCEAAAAQGMNTIVFQSPAQLRTALAEYEIKPRESATAA